MAVLRALAFVVSLAACGHAYAPRMRTSSGALLRQCLPGAHIVIFDRTLALDQYEAAQASLAYWDQFGPLFVDGGYMAFDLADAAQGFTVVTFDDALELAGACGITTLGAYVASGCIAESVIRINPACADDLGTLVTTMRHELGHVLGLAHSDNPRALMYPFSGSFRQPLPIEIETATRRTK